VWIADGWIYAAGFMSIVVGNVLFYLCTATNYDGVAKCRSLVVVKSTLLVVL
jgi:hypothetical protein